MKKTEVAIQVFFSPYKKVIHFGYSIFIKNIFTLCLTAPHSHCAAIFRFAGLVWEKSVLRNFGCKNILNGFHHPASFCKTCIDRSELEASRQVHLQPKLATAGEETAGDQLRPAGLHHD